MKKTKMLTILVLFLGCLVVPNQIFSQTDSAISTLKGIDTLKVEVEQLAADLQKAGITTEEIQNEVETKLRRAGLKVKNKTDTVTPYVVLYVSVNSIDNGVGGFAVSVTSSLNQLVILDRNRSLVSVASTWDSRSIISVIKEKVQSIKDFVNIQIDLFITAYRKANSSTVLAKPKNKNNKK